MIAVAPKQSAQIFPFIFPVIDLLERETAIGALASHRKDEWRSIPNGFAVFSALASGATVGRRTSLMCLG